MGYCSHWFYINFFKKLQKGLKTITIKSKLVVVRARNRYPRLDHFLADSISHISRSKLEQLIKSGNVSLNGILIRKKNREILPGDKAEIKIPIAAEEKIRSGTPFEKLYEDQYLLIIDKPSGISVHSGAGEKQETILDSLVFFYPQILEIKNTERPGIVHRIDKDTSGVLLLAKDFRTQNKLMKQFKRRQVKKEYLAIVEGKLRYRNGTFDKAIARSKTQRVKFRAVDHGSITEARESLTHYSVLLEFKSSSLLKLSPLTGRTHQIRVHLSDNQTPVLGDRLYGNGRSFQRLALHASSLEFCHPMHQSMVIRAHSPLPLEFRKYLIKELQLKKGDG